jgi:predicted metal-binding membrane protein
MNMQAMPSMPGMSSMPGMVTSAHTSAAHAAIGGLPMWAVMVTAMMLPGALPALSHVATHSYRWRRRRAMNEFTLVYLALWIAVGAFALTIARLVHFNSGLAFALALVLACAWQLTRFKIRAVRDCHRGVPLPPDGASATAGIVRFGLVNGSACIRACWPAMLAMAVVPASQMLFWMAVLTGLITAEKFTRRPRLTSRLVATALAISAIAAVVVA